MERPVIYVVVNKGLEMSGGKLAAQVGHAVAGLHFDKADWLVFHHRWLIVLAADDGEHLYHLHEYLQERLIRQSLYRVIDEGVNEIRPFSITALGVGPLDKDSEDAVMLASLPVYKHEVSKKERKLISTEGWNAGVRYMKNQTLWNRVRNKSDG